MKHKYFLKKSHFPVEIFFLIIYFLLVGLNIFAAIQHKKITVPQVTDIVLLTAIILPPYIRFHTMGLYIDGKDITVKKFFTAQKVDPRDIAAIKILQSYYIIKGSREPLVGEKGMPLYTAFLLNSVTGEVYKFKQDDVQFKQYYQKHIICGVVSDLEAIRYLKTLNPRIRII